MEEEKQRHIDIQNLRKFQEFYSLKKELEYFCDKLDSIADIDLSDKSRVTLTEEVYGRRWASQHIKDFLYELGLLDKKYAKRDMTME